MITLALCVLIGAGAANAKIATVTQTLDYTDDGGGNNWFFWPPTIIVDHAPFHRHAWEDWDWTHDMSALAPNGVTGIDSATLSILAWGVDDQAGEVDYVYADGVKLGALQGPGNGQPVPPAPPEMYNVDGQPNGAFTLWSVTPFTLPADVLQDLLQDGQVDIRLNIDAPVEGHRVTIRSSTLRVNYTVPGDDETATPDVSVYRFWSPVLSGHFYTISEQERDMLINQYPDVWTYEGVAYHTFSDALDANLRPVYRFWSGQAHFYTISEQERDMLIRDFPSVWTYEGIAFYAYPEGLQPAGASPVYRFWSNNLSKHFYTISESEKQMIVDQYSYTWGLEGVAWYAYE